uniref:Laminin G domain-containing protein n=1 Tax=Panagrolaimus sp. JU765 TaxID=591449 RepID=A0AC34QSH1_9BILA
MVGGETVGESLDEVVDENETTKVDISIDFDAMVVFVNGQKLPYNAEPLPRNDDSLWIDLGGDNSHVACIGIRELRVSGVQIKLEYGTPIGLKYCDPGDELEIAEESLDKDLGHTDNSEHENSVDKQDKEQILEKTKELDEINEENNGEASEVDPNQAEKQFEKEKIQEQSEFEKSNQENMAKKLDELLNQPEILNDFAATTAKSADPEVPNCLPHQRAACGSNFRNCVGIRNSEGRLFEHKFNCICKSGFSGKFCQFSLLPRSCFEAFALNTGTVNEPGVYELDVDGSGPLMPTWAFCNRDAVTVVEHNMPNDTIIRTTAEESDKFFPISYKFFPQPQLKKLIGNSFSCKQSVAYKCQNAALGFATNQTWFDVASGKVVKHIGSKADQCPCAEENCLDKKKCNCDSLQETADEGILYGEESGITTVFAVRNVDGNGMGKMTLSALECEGNAGHFPENSITFKSAAAALNHTTPEPVEYFEFEFRTIQDDIESLVTQQQGELTAQISLLDAYTLQLKITENGGPLAQSTVKSQSNTFGSINRQIPIKDQRPEMAQDSRGSHPRPGPVRCGRPQRHPESGKQNASIKNRLWILSRIRRNPNASNILILENVLVSAKTDLFIEAKDAKK